MSWSRQSTLTPPICFCVSPETGSSGLCMSCFVFHVYIFHVTLVFKGNSFTFTVYTDVMGPATAYPVVWGFPRRSLRTGPTGGHGLTFSSRWCCYVFDLYTIHVPTFVNFLQSKIPCGKMFPCAKGVCSYIFQLFGVFSREDFLNFRFFRPY